MNQQLSALVNSATGPMLKLKALATEARALFEKCCVFFHEDPKKTTAEVVFRAFSSLATSFSDFKSQRERAAANAARQEKIRIMKEAAEEEKLRKKQHAEAMKSAGQPEPSEEPKEVETAVEDFRKRLRKGNVIRARKAPTAEAASEASAEVETAEQRTNV